MAETADDKLKVLVGRVGKVRRWLVALAVMKIAALCLIFASVYIGAYAWLDHRLNFGELGRITALVLLLAGTSGLLVLLRTLLMRRVSWSGAAGHIENRRSFNQQLVAAMEYHENKHEYPYSRVLAERLVVRVDKDCAGFRFDSTVEKWQGYVLGAIILFGLATAWFYVRDNYVYFSAYFARLANPTASVKPLSSTRLQSITRDIVAEPNSEVTFAAGIEGRTPESAKLVVMKLPESTSDGQASKPEQTPVKPTAKEGQSPRLEASRNFSQAGRYKYRFEAESGSSDWHELTVCPAPEIESMTAEVAMPKRPPERAWVKPYTEQIENNTLEVIEGSTVALNVQATEKLREVVITASDGTAITKQLNGAQQFSFHFSAEKSNSLKFDLVNEQGLTNTDLPELEVVVKTDEPPKIKLVCPDGDYLATDVASIPIKFEITDDFGLDSARMFLEIPGRQPQEFIIPIEGAAKKVEYSQTIELEEYELAVGDSILFHAEASDIDTGSAQAKRTASGEVYFIEIRPYRQNWKPSPGGGPGKGGAAPPVGLLNILEYTRAVLKKTWAVAGKPNPTQQDLLALDSIDNDVQYCAEQLAVIRDDSDYGFSDAHKSALNVILKLYEKASKHLSDHDADSAIAPEKDAYRLLRKFILEFELQWNPPSSGQGQQPQQPDSVKLQEKPEFSEYEKERIEGEIKKVQQELKKLTNEQKSLKRTFENFLKQQAQEANSATEAAAEKSKADSGKQQGQSGQNSSQQADQNNQSLSSGQGNGGGKDSQSSQSASSGGSPGKQDAGDRQEPTGSQSGSKDASGQDSKTGSDKQDEGEGRGSGSTRSPSENEKTSTGSDPSAGNSAKDGQNNAPGQTGPKGGSPANQRSPSGPDAQQGQGRGSGQSGSEDRNSQQNAGATGQSSGDGGSPTQGRGGEQGQDGAQRASAGSEARLRMLQARQRALQEQVAQLKRQLQQLPQVSGGEAGNGRDKAQEHLDEAVARMEDVQDKLSEARYRAQMETKESEDAAELMESAGRQIDMATQALDDELGLSDAEKLAQQAQKMAEQLAEDADALDESVTPEQERDMLALLEQAKRLLETMPEPQWTTVDQGPGTQSSTGLVYTRGSGLPPAEAARQLARQFWSISIDARKRRQQLSEDEPSDVRFYGQENEFFENAARFDEEQTRR